MTKWICAILTILAIATTRNPAVAETLELSPTEVVVLTEDGSGVAKVALRFDLSVLPQGSNLHIAGANLEWTADDAPAGEASYWLEPLVESWDRTAVAAGSTVLVRGNRTDESLMLAADRGQANDLVRLDMGGLLNAWLAEPQKNFGILVGSPTSNREAMSNQAAIWRLVVRYSLVRPPKVGVVTGTAP